MFRQSRHQVVAGTAPDMCAVETRTCTMLVCPVHFLQRRKEKATKMSAAQQQSTHAAAAASAAHAGTCGNQEGKP